MKIGIIIYSETGNTLMVAEKIKEQLESKKFNVNLEQITKDSTNINKNRIMLDNCPDPSLYDVIIFGAPVHAFSLALEMKTYLEKLPTLESKRVECFVTHQFPKSWMGGNRSVKQIVEICKQKGAIINKSGVIDWSNKKRHDEIEELINLFVADID